MALRLHWRMLPALEMQLPVVVMLMLTPVIFPAPLPSGFPGSLDGEKGAGMEMITHNMTCSVSSDCRENQYCHLTSVTGECKECKPKEKECIEDGECCLGGTCIEGRCDEGSNVSDSWTRCDPSRDRCPPGFCCSKTETVQFPVCIPLPREGEQCRSQTMNLFELLNLSSAMEPAAGYCPCGEGLVCPNKGVNIIPTCEKPEEVLDFTAYRGESLFEPLVRRDEEFTYYDMDLLPWPAQDDQLAVVDLSRATEESKVEAEKTFNMPSDDVAKNFEDKSFTLDKHVSGSSEPTQQDFLELKQLAKQMGQEFGPGFY
ncbi:uncharacterized protein LOC128470272 [Spea bombifrons]|uniref:uncharacterized protein LOC128470272 n=1 Tax=Spea bombifrons TaxID=233779 RepID=UPI00234A2A87|nr:uncharacterized protein LOC128470272 [Spea bombifrons]